MKYQWFIHETLQDTSDAEQGTQCLSTTQSLRQNTRFLLAYKCFSIDVHSVPKAASLLVGMENRGDYSQGRVGGER